VASKATAERTPGRPGRPRRFEADEERQLIFDAAFEVMRRSGTADVTVQHILAEAGVSTRSFYRHFASKDELLNALFVQDAEQFSASIARRVAAAPTLVAGVDVWIDEILGFGFGRARAKRAAVLGSPTAMAALTPGVLERTRALLVAPLVDLLGRGHANGTFELVDPARDGALVSAVAWEASGRISRATGAERRAIRASTLDFVHRALGI
jgi:AcrR family transcriptional regulator